MIVIVAGTFDVLHPGHMYLFEEAAALGDLYVIIARDRNISKEKIIFNEKERLKMVQSLKPVTKAILGDEKDFFRLIEDISPDYLFLGPDQDYEWVKSQIKKRNLTIKVKQLTERLPYSSTEIRNRICEEH